MPREANYTFDGWTKWDFIIVNLLHELWWEIDVCGDKSVHKVYNELIWWAQL